MFNRSFISVLIVTSAFTLVFGQTPEAKTEKIVRTMALSFDGDGGYLGVSTQEVSKANFAKLGLREVRGVAVERVSESSPAAAAGIQAGDVIVRFNGEEVTSTRKLTRLISEVAPDHQVRVTILRGGSEQEITATLGKRPMPKFEGGNFTFSTPGPMGGFDLEKLGKLPELKEFPQMKDFPKGEMPKAFSIPGGEGQVFTWRAGEGRQIGVGVTPLSKQLAEHFGVEGGVMINDVRENSPAAKAGLKAGDIIVEVDGKAVKGDLDLIRAINGKKEGDVTLTIVRDGNRQTVTVTPEASKDGGFFFKDEDGLTRSPGLVRMARPAIPATLMAAPAPMTLFRPGRIL